MVKAGEGAIFCAQTVQELLKAEEIKVIIDMQAGEDSAKLWTTDLSYEYVEINAHYRT